MENHSTAGEAVASAKSMLRRTTHCLHQRLHEHPLLRDLTPDRITLKRYQRILKAFLGFYRPLENSLVTAGLRLNCPRAYGDNIRTRWLIEDLRNLGFTYEVIDSMPSNNVPLTSATRAEFAGCLYVVEGSALGGIGIARSLIKSLKLQPNCGVRFFSSYGEGTGSNWRRVCDFVESTCVTDDERDLAIQMARKTFCSLDNWLLKSVEDC